MQLEFFPSRTLTAYLARLFVVRVLAVLLMLVLVLQTLDLLGESGKILAAPGNGQAQLWTYVGLRIPQLVARFLPYSVLLATIITLAALNQNSEVIAMKAAGLSVTDRPVFMKGSSRPSTPMKRPGVKPGTVQMRSTTPSSSCCTRSRGCPPSCIAG